MAKQKQYVIKPLAVAGQAWLALVRQSDKRVLAAITDAGQMKGSVIDELQSIVDSLIEDLAAADAKGVDRG